MRTLSWIVYCIVLPFLLSACHSTAKPDSLPSELDPTSHQEPAFPDLSAFFSDPVATGIIYSDWNERKRFLIEYASLAQEEQEVSLLDLSLNRNSSQTLFNRRAAFLFHMVRLKLGDKKFTHVIETLAFREKTGPVSWNEIRTVLEKETGQDFRDFFSQWLERKGIPDVGIENARMLRNGSAFKIILDLTQNKEVYKLEIPVKVNFSEGRSKIESVRVETKKNSITIDIEDEPLSIVIDGDYDIFRRLTHDETPPLIHRVLGSFKPLLVLPEPETDVYKEIIGIFAMQKVEERNPSTVSDADIRKSSLVLLDSRNPVLKRIFGKAGIDLAGTGIVVRKNPWNADNVIAIIQADSATDAGSLARNLSQYGGSTSVFAAKEMEATTAESERGIIVKPEQETTVVDLSLLKTLTQVVEGAADKKIIYLGESHDRFSHHNVQIQVIKGLARKNPNIAIGMEMFQRPFQKHLDDYIDGSIDEKEFLKKSEYFKRWGFDYNLYKPILDFALQNKIPVVALNIKREITEKVSKGGLDSLSEDEKKELPELMDFSDHEYRNRLEHVFSQHKKQGRNFDFFYQAQILWDETMAESIDLYLRKHADKSMAVIVGGGHIIFESGIPKRAFRRNNLPYTTMLNDEEIQPGAANYIVYPPALDGLTAPRLMAGLDDTGGDLIITAFQPGSVAQAAGLKVRDRIVSIDDKEVTSVPDLKLLLFYKKKGETVRVKIMRKGFFRGVKEMVFSVRL